MVRIASEVVVLCKPTEANPADATTSAMASLLLSEKALDPRVHVDVNVVNLEAGAVPVDADLALGLAMADVDLALATADGDLVSKA
jgi:hypothetical protein